MPLRAKVAGCRRGVAAKMRALLVSAIAGAALLAVPALARNSTAAGAVAWVDFVAAPNKTLAQIATFKRGGHAMAIQQIRVGGLLKGDVVQVTDSQSLVLVRYLATGKVVVLRQSAELPGAAYVVTTTVAGLPGSLYKSFGEVLRNVSAQITNFEQGFDQGNDSYVVAAARSVTVAGPNITCPNPAGKSNEPIRFRVPALNPYVNKLAAGQRTLFVEWRGGVEPYSLSLTDGNHKTIVEMKAIQNTCSVTLPVAGFDQGELNFNFRDGNNTHISTQPIDVVAKRPDEPVALLKARMPADARTLYYATWLTTQDNGVWTFEAMQLVRALDCHAPGAVEWLARYGQPGPCLDGIGLSTVSPDRASNRRATKNSSALPVR